MPTTSLVYGSSLANTTGTGSKAWSNPTNAAGNNTSDATRATVDLTGGFSVSSNYLTCTLAFGLTGSDTINGITVAVRRFSTLNDTDAPLDNIIKLIKNGTIGGTNKAVAGAWPQVGTWSANYGSTSDLWGLTFIGSDTIGVAISAIGVDPNDFAYVTAIRAQATYTSSGGSTPQHTGFFKLLGA